MKEQLISFETAKLAKEKGFDELTQHVYGHNKTNANYGKAVERPVLYGTTVIFAPTQSLLQKWLREEKGISVEVGSYNDGWSCDLVNKEGHIKELFDNGGVFDTYEEALEEGLKEALRLC